ncbi:hypothetical protein [Risungbinella massiliensis]|uniref:hypothetical protein n=1 Tax=Risungbinella massiliensis TaxID=1329796 RepID=UPI0005CB92A6|nr:hypothetical protein [Risungbinella massiliensis]
MRKINILGAFLVLICNIAVSFHHSLELFRSGGFTNGLEYLAVVAAEITFIMGGLNIVASRLAGYSPGLPAYLGGLLGVALVGWSNVSAGWNYGVTGILLGAFTPLSLILSEAILSRAIIQGRKQQNQEISGTDHSIPAYKTMNNVSSEENETVDILKPIIGQQVLSVESERKESFSSTEPIMKTEVAKTNLEGSSINKSITETNETLTHTEPTREASSMQVEVGALATTKPEPVDKDENTGTTTKTSGKIDDIAKIIEIAKKVEVEEGKRPGRVRLAKLAQCTPYYARVALEELKEAQTVKIG